MEIKRGLEGVVFTDAQCVAGQPANCPAALRVPPQF
jgi:hypothetical protein